MSDTLLFLEQRAFADIGQSFHKVSDRIERRILRTPWLGLRTDPVFQSGLKVDCQTAINACLPGVIKLLEASADVAGRSIDRELTVCEGAAARRFKGSASRSRATVLTVSGDLVEQSVASFQISCEPVVPAFVADVNRQIGLAVLYEEEKSALVARILSPVPVNALGQSGVGSLWRSAASMRALARGSSIELVNVLRSEAMKAANRV